MDFVSLDNFIRDIQEWHNQVAELWEQSEDYKNINLAKKLVKDVVDDGTQDYLEGYIFKHRAFLNQETAVYAVELGQRDYACCKIESRVKNQNSILDKLATYRKSGLSGRESLNGEVPLKKCLNDLFGIRYIIEEKDIDLDGIEDHTKAVFHNLKVIKRDVRGYKGVHIYFQKNNYIFPWELQIWRSEDEKSNKDLHHEYKQEYTKWEKESHEGG